MGKYPLLGGVRSPQENGTEYHPQNAFFRDLRLLEGLTVLRRRGIFHGGIWWRRDGYYFEFLLIRRSAFNMFTVVGQAKGTP